MKEKNKKRISHPLGFTFRCDSAILSKLEELSSIFGVYKRDIIEIAILDFYSKHLNK